MNRIRYEYIRPVMHLVFLVAAFYVSQSQVQPGDLPGIEDVLDSFAAFFGTYLSLLIVEVIFEYIKIDLGAVLLGAFLSFMILVVSILILTVPATAISMILTNRMSNATARAIFLPLYLAIEFFTRRRFPKVGPRSEKKTSGE